MRSSRNYFAAKAPIPTTKAPHATEGILDGRELQPLKPPLQARRPNGGSDRQGAGRRGRCRRHGDTRLSKHPLRSSLTLLTLGGLCNLGGLLIP